MQKIILILPTIKNKAKKLTFTLKLKQTKKERKTCLEQTLTKFQREMESCPYEYLIQIQQMTLDTSNYGSRDNLLLTLANDMYNIVFKTELQLLENRYQMEMLDQPNYVIR